MIDYWVVEERASSDREKRRFTEPVPDWVDLDPVFGGHGYYGVLLCDPSTGLVQCHVCGKWFAFLGGHVKLHGYRGNEYKEEFELGNLGLCSLDLWQTQHDHGVSMVEQGILGGDKGRFGEFEGGGGVSSLRHKYMIARASKEAERRAAVSKAQKERYKDPAQREARKELMDRIRPLAVAKTKGKKRAPFTDEHKAKIGTYQRNRTQAHKSNMVEGIRERHRKAWEEDKLRILSFVGERVQVTSREVADLLGCCYQTAVTKLRKLTKAGELRKCREGKRTVYRAKVCREVIRGR